MYRNRARSPAKLLTVWPRMGECENALLAAILEWQSTTKGTKAASGELDWKAIMKIITKNSPDLVPTSMSGKKGGKGGSIADWRDLWVTISTSYTRKESDKEKCEKEGSVPLSSSASSSGAPAKAGNKRKYNDDHIESVESLNSMNVLACKVYNDLSKGLHLEGNASATAISSTSSVNEARKKIKDGYQEGRPVMHNYDASVNMLFYPTIMTYVQDDQPITVRAPRTGLTGRAATLNPTTNKVVLRLMQPQMQR